MGWIIPSGTAGFQTGTTLTVTLPTAVRDGDMIVVWMASAANPTTAYGAPAGYTIKKEKDGTASWGGRAILATHTWRVGDTMSPAFTGPAGTIVWNCACVRSDTDGDSLTYQHNVTYDSEQTATHAFITLAAYGALQTNDMRLACYVLPATATVTVQTGAVTTASAFHDLGGGVSTIKVGMWWTTDADGSPTGWDFAAFSPAQSVIQKSYTISPAWDDGTSTTGMAIGYEVEMDQGLTPVIFGTDTGTQNEALETVFGFGGGASIT